MIRLTSSTFTTRIFHLFVCFGLMFTAGLAQAPVNLSNGSQNASGSSSGNTAQNSSTNLQSDTVEGMVDRAFDTESDSVDFEEGTLHWKGQTFNLGSNRAMRARMERYLARSGMTPQQKEYLKLMDKIEQKLSILKQTNPENADQEVDDFVFEAWRQLFEAGEYPLDNGLSLITANLVNNAWRVRDETRNANRYRNELKERKKDLQTKVLQDTFWQKKEFQDIQKKVAREDHTGERLEDRDDIPTESIYSQKEIAEVEARIAALNTQTTSSATELKLQFQSQMLQFLMQRRYRHVLIAAAFYRHLFKGSHQGLEVGEKQLSEFLPNSEMQPTVDMLEFVAREAMRDVEKGMQAVNNQYENGERFGALQRLQETFFLGEYMPQVVSFDGDKKQMLLDLFRNTRKLKRVVDFKDYAKAEKRLQEIQAIASDFPASNISSAISTAMRTSNLAVMKAKQSMAAGDLERGEKAMQKATELWPLNPAIMEYSKNLTEQADLGTQAKKVFDEYYSSKDYRKIYDKKEKLGAAFVNDEERAEKLEQVVQKMGEVDFLLKKVEEAMAQNDPYYAWETLLQAEQIYADDLELQRKKANVNMEVADYAKMLKRAREARERGDYAVALTQYLRARKTYPASRTSRLGIEKTSEAILSEKSN